MALPTSTPRAVVIPFGVPAEGRGLGLGLAALVHGFTQIDGQSVGLAQLFGKRTDEPDSAAPRPSWNGCVLSLRHLLRPKIADGRASGQLERVISLR